MVDDLAVDDGVDEGVGVGLPRPEVEPCEQFAGLCAGGDFEGLHQIAGAADAGGLAVFGVEQPGEELCGFGAHPDLQQRHPQVHEDACGVGRGEAFEGIQGHPAAGGQVGFGDVDDLRIGDRVREHLVFAVGVLVDEVDRPVQIVHETGQHLDDFGLTAAWGGAEQHRRVAFVGGAEDVEVDDLAERVLLVDRDGHPDRVAEDGAPDR